MTTSSANSTPSKIRPSGDHWFEMTAILSVAETAVLGQWISDSLIYLEQDLDQFSSPRSRGDTVTRR